MKQITFFLVLCLSLSASAKTIDLRNKTDVDGGVREVSFCARPTPGNVGLPGHAFVTFALIKKDGEIIFRSIGHTVFSIGAAIMSYDAIIPASGALKLEYYTSTKQECLTVQINKDEYESVYASVTQPLLSLGIKFDETLPVGMAYTLAVDDCVQFVVSIADKFVSKGLKSPKRNSNELPFPYIRRLIDSN